MPNLNSSLPPTTWLSHILHQKPRGGETLTLSPLQLQTLAVTEGHQTPASLLNPNDTLLLIAAVVLDHVTPVIVQVTQMFSPLNLLIQTRVPLLPE